MPRIPRKKKPTEAPKTSTSIPLMLTERAIVYIDPNCHKNLVDMYCERLENPALTKYLYNNTLDESWSVSMKLGATLSSDSACKKLNKHNQCLQSTFRAKCEQTMALAFIKIDKFVQQCAGFGKRKQSSSSPQKKFESNSLIRFFMIFFVNILYLTTF